MPTDKTTKLTKVDARWEQVTAMSAEDWETVAPRVSVCIDCAGPALLTDAELEQVIATPRCTRCRRAAEAAA